MSGAVVDDLVMAEWTMASGESIASLTFEVRDRESEQMTGVTLRTCHGTRHLYLVFTHSYPQSKTQTGRDLTLASYPPGS
jgi:hypothetical protein